MNISNKIVEYKQSLAIVRQVKELFNTGHWMKGDWSNASKSKFCVLGGIGQVSFQMPNPGGGQLALKSHPALTHAFGEALLEVNGMNATKDEVDINNADEVESLAMDTNDGMGKKTIMEALDKTEQKLEHCLAEYEAKAKVPEAKKKPLQVNA